MVTEPNENENINLCSVPINKTQLLLPSEMANKSNCVIISPTRVYFTVLLFSAQLSNSARDAILLVNKKYVENKTKN